MPSFLKKFGKKSNPYLNAHHPGHNPVPQSTSTTTTASTTQARPAIHLRPASPRGSSDMLAEARQASGRDPVTGRRRQDMSSQNASEQIPSDGNPVAQVRQGGQDERTVYQARAAHSERATGNQYDLTVQEMAAQRAREARERAARGGVEYYAPERRVEEFYAGGVRD